MYSRILTSVDSACGTTMIAMAAEYLRVWRPLLAAPYLDHYEGLFGEETRDKARRGAAFYFNELGVVMYQRRQYRDAHHAFRSGLLRVSGSGTPVEHVLLVNGDIANVRVHFEDRDTAALVGTVAMMLGRETVYPPRWRALVHELSAILLPVTTPARGPGWYVRQQRALVAKAIECLAGPSRDPAGVITVVPMAATAAPDGTQEDPRPAGFSTVPSQLHRLLAYQQLL